MRTLLGVLVIFILLSVQTATAGEPYYEFAAGDVLVKLSPAANVSPLCDLIGAKAVYHSEELDYWRLEVECGMERDAVERLRADSRVEWANYNYIFHSTFVPNDPAYVAQWHYPKINLPQAWDLTRGTQSVVVAICDMGFYFAHEDWVGLHTTSPHDFIGNDNDPSTTVDDSHANHVTGTIFATTNNHLGVAGIAPLCTLMPVRVLDDSGSGTEQQVADGISWASSHGANVMNLSFAIRITTTPPPDPGPPLSTAIQQAAAAGVVICAAAGNDAVGFVAYPAAYSQCIAVGATEYDDLLAPYSNYGTALDLVAPGGNLNQDLNQDGYADGVLSTQHNAALGNYYEFLQGTSMASPHVAGVAALLISHGTAQASVRNALQMSAVDLGTAGRDDHFGYGRINAFAALRWPLEARNTPTNVFSFTLGDPYPNPFNSNVIIPLELSIPAKVELVVYDLLGRRVTTLSPYANLNSGSHSFRWDARDAASGIYFVKLEAQEIEQTRKIVLIK